VHYSFEALGTKTTAEQAFGMLRPGGTATLIGMVSFRWKETQSQTVSCRAGDGRSVESKAAIHL
jgi:threonine dehydrogenase-like Zn-dependent dehydrogenase